MLFFFFFLFVKNFLKLLVVFIIVLYLEMLVMEFRASKIWVLLIRGIMFMVNILRFFFVSCFISSGFCLGYRKLIKVVLFLKFVIFFVRGVLILRIMLDLKVFFLEMILVFVLVYLSFLNFVFRFVFFLMLMLNFFFVSIVIVVGDMVIRRLFLNIFLGISMVSLL